MSGNRAILPGLVAIVIAALPPQPVPSVARDRTSAAASGVAAYDEEARQQGRRRPLLQRTAYCQSAGSAGQATEVAETERPPVRLAGTSSAGVRLAGAQEEARGPLVRTAIWSPQVRTTPDTREWRRTRQGWQRIDVSGAPLIHWLELPRPKRMVHPVQVAVLVLLAAAAAVAWSSDEWDWHRMAAPSR